MFLGDNQRKNNIPPPYIPKVVKVTIDFNLIIYFLKIIIKKIDGFSAYVKRQETKCRRKGALGKRQGVTAKIKTQKARDVKHVGNGHDFRE